MKILVKQTIGQPSTVMVLHPDGRHLDFSEAEMSALATEHGREFSFPLSEDDMVWFIQHGLRPIHAAKPEGARAWAHRHRTMDPWTQKAPGPDDEWGGL